jgi:hypothetical protein
MAGAGDSENLWNRLFGFKRAREDLVAEFAFCTIGSKGNRFVVKSEFVDGSDAVLDPSLRVNVVEDPYARRELTAFGARSVGLVEEMPRRRTCRQRPQVYSPVIALVGKGDAEDANRMRSGSFALIFSKTVPRSSTRDRI